MSELRQFLSRHVEGYLFDDLRLMKQHALGYPPLMSTFAGIELLGGLMSPAPFSPYKGKDYFVGYWTLYLYPDPNVKRNAGLAIYQLARHGIAHGFLPKGPIGVWGGHPGSHLARDAEGLVLIDVAQFADDLIESYDRQVKPRVALTAGDVSGVTMAARLKEMINFAADAVSEHDLARLFPPREVPLLGGVAATPAISQSAPPSRQQGPTGPI